MNHGAWTVLAGVLLISCTDNTEAIHDTAGAGGTADASAGGSGGIAGQAGAGGAAGAAGLGGTAGSAGSLQDGGAYDPPLTLITEYQNPGNRLVFTNFFQTDPQKRCYTKLVDTCQVIDCLSSTYGKGGVLGAPVGDITFGGSDAGADLVLTPDTNGVYAAKSISKTMWKAGDVVSVSAPGDELPGFNLTLKILDAPQMIEPTFADAGANPVDVDRSTLWKLTWQATDESVQIQIGQFPTAMQSDGPWDFLAVVCQFPGSAGEGTIPSEALKGLAANPATSLAAYHAAVQDLTLGSRPMKAWSATGISRSVNVK
jgi:hypothetical protein